MYQNIDHITMPEGGKELRLKAQMVQWRLQLNLQMYVKYCNNKTR